MFKFILVLIFASLQAYAYVPTAESLFRFPSLLQGEGNYKSLVFSLDGASENKTQPRLYRLSYHHDERYSSTPTYISQMMYQGTEVKDEDLLNLKHINSLSLRSFKDKSRNVMTVFLYTLMQGMLWHDGKFVLDAFRNFQISLTYNRELINPDYARLLRDYKAYVKVEKDDPKTTIDNPLAPIKAEDREKMQATLKKGLVTANNQVKREFENGKFTFYIREGSFEAKFLEDSRELVWIKFIYDNIAYEITFKDYLAFKGKYRFPQLITFKTSEKIVEIKTHNIWVRSENWSAFSRRKGEELTQKRGLRKTIAFPDIML